MKKLNKLIDELLNANSIGLGQLAIWKETFNLVALVRESVAFLSTKRQPLIVPIREVLRCLQIPVR